MGYNITPVYPSFFSAIYFRGEMTTSFIPSKIEWDLTNGPPRKLLGLLDTQV